MSPLTTLITPIYNAMPYLRDYLNCVIGQTWRPLEFIPVDDGSTDGSREYLEEMIPALERAGITVRPLYRSHQGQAAAVNAALPLITGEYLTWCDADDRITPDNIEKKVRYLMEHPELGMVRNDGLVLDGDTGREKRRSTKEQDRSTQNIFDALFRGATYCHAGCYMLRTSLFFACYPDKQIPLSREGQNLQLLLPPASRTDCGFLPEILHWYCQRSSGHSSRKRGFWESRARIRNFSKLRRAILPYCACGQREYRKLDHAIRKRELFRHYCSVLSKIKRYFT